jgi:hypothetical protein
MAEPTSGAGGTWKEGKLWKMVFAVAGIMTTLVTYGVLQVQSSFFKNSICLFVYLCRLQLFAIFSNYVFAFRIHIVWLFPLDC